MNNIKILYSLVLFVTIIFSGCTRQSSSTEQPNEPLITQTTLTFATQLSTPSLTGTSAFIPTQITVTPSITFTVKPTKTPTITPFPETYPLKKVWIEFGSTPNGHADFEFAFPVTIPTWVLFTDGTMILYRNNSFQTKKLTNNEICSLLARIDQLGFYQIKTNGISYRDDPIYVNAPPEKLWTDDSYEYLIVNGMTPKRLWVYDPIREYAIQEVKMIMNSLRTYSPINTQPYLPDRLGLYVANGRPYSEFDRLEAIPWPSESTSLAEKNEFGALYIEEDMATQIFEIFKKPFTWLVFTDKGQEYSVIARPILPHEHRTNYGIEIDTTPDFEPPFTCK